MHTGVGEQVPMCVYLIGVGRSVCTSVEHTVTDVQECG